MKPSQTQHEYVERVGRWWETGTGSRAAGRILGWLMICEPTHRSAAQLVDELELSAGSVSTQFRLLEGLGFVERVTFPGDRVTYYQLKPDVWLHVMKGELDHIKNWLTIADVGADVLPEERPERVTDVGLIARFFLDRWPSFLDELISYIEKERQK